MGFGEDVAEDGVELFVFVEVFAFEGLAIEFVDLVKLEGGLGLKATESADGLSRQSAAIHEEKYAAGDASLHQAVDLVDQGEGFAGARGHCHQHFTPTVGDGLLDGGVGFNLVGAEPRVGIGRGGEGAITGFDIMVEHFLKSRRGVEAGYFPRAIKPVAHVVEPDHLAVGGVKEGDVQSVKVERISAGTPGVALRLGEDVLGAEGEFLGFEDAEDLGVEAEGVVGRAVIRGVFLDPGCAAECVAGPAPPGSVQQRINPPFPGQPLVVSFIVRHGHGSQDAPRPNFCSKGEPRYLRGCGRDCK